jgi:hypothetical protein
MTKRSQLRRQDPDDLVPADCRQSPQRFQKHRPKTDKGKQRSRGNALRHGLTAETVIGTLEDAHDYKAFEAAVAADFDAHLRLNESWSCGLRDCYGDCAARRASKSVC